jgi:predicted transposase YdaD
MMLAGMEPSRLSAWGMADEDFQSPHDHLVRSVLSRQESAISYLQSQLPTKLGERVDWASLTRLSGSFITEEMRSLHSDFVFEVALDGNPLHLYCLLEHQSGPERFMPLRLLGYLVNFHNQWLRENPGARHLPPVIPMVLHSGSGRWTVPCRFSELMKIPDQLRETLSPLLVDFEHLLLDLSQVEMEEMEQIGDEIVARTMLMLLKAAADDEMGGWLDAHAASFTDILSQQDGRGALNAFLRYLCRSASGIKLSTVREKLATLHSPQIEEEMMTIADELMLQGEKKGRKEGRSEGRSEGLRVGRIQMLEELLGRKTTPTDTLTRKSESELCELERVLSARFQSKRSE